MAPLPVEYEIDMMIFVLCDSDLTRRHEVEALMYVDALRWLCLADYQNYVTKEMTRRAR